MHQGVVQLWLQGARPGCAGRRAARPVPVRVQVRHVRQGQTAQLLDPQGYLPLPRRRDSRGSHTEHHPGLRQRPHRDRGEPLQRDGLGGRHKVALAPLGGLSDPDAGVPDRAGALRLVRPGLLPVPERRAAPDPGLLQPAARPLLHGVRGHRRGRQPHAAARRGAGRGAPGGPHLGLPLRGPAEEQPHHPTAEEGWAAARSLCEDPAPPERLHLVVHQPGRQNDVKRSAVGVAPLRVPPRHRHDATYEAG
mmetsp:Transcript_4593/g.13038  ORF Transcript_4593/g.13038 Transcript_4593/m.13038 type:complete len:250 (+) Transcript_4593:676-1425(+)